MNKVLFRSLSLLFLLLTSTACGFHLRGSYTTPRWMRHVNIVIQQAHPSLLPLLKVALDTNKITTEAIASKKFCELVIINDRLYQGISSISASTIPRQYHLNYEVNFTLINSLKKEILPYRSVHISRQLTLNNNRILASDTEESTLSQDMRKEAVARIITEIQHVPQCS